MKFSRLASLAVFCLFLTAAYSAHAESLAEKVETFERLFNYPSSSTQVASKSSRYNRGETRPKSILKGVFYIGGSDRKRELLSGSFLDEICEDGFSRVYSVYRSVDRTVHCSNNSISYRYIGEARDSGGGANVRELLQYLYNEVINGDNGAVLLHCHYGVHASNTIAQMVQMQFCGISKSEAKRNWDVIDLYDSLGAKGRSRQFEKIDGFTPYADLRLTAAQQELICR